MFEIDRLDSRRPYGVTVTGLREADLVDAEIRERLRALWVEHGLILFRGDVSESFHVALSQVFGDLETHPVREVLSPTNPKIINVRYDTEKEAIWEIDGKPLGGWLPWHSDLIYVDRINHGGILRAIDLPSAGGETGFIDRIEAYDALPDTMKTAIENLSIVYKMRIDFGEMRYVSRSKVRLARTSAYIESLRERQDRDFPLVVHPIVYRQPETGRRVLNVSPMDAEYILGMDTEEGHRLLRELVDFASDESLAYYHGWKLDEMVLWDNWRILHNAPGCSSAASRHMQRTTIAGDYALGRKLSDIALDAVPAAM